MTNTPDTLNNFGDDIPTSPTLKVLREQYIAHLIQKGINPIEAIEDYEDLTGNLEGELRLQIILSHLSNT